MSSRIVFLLVLVVAISLPFVVLRTDVQVLVGVLFVLCLVGIFVFRLFVVPGASSPSDSLFGLVFELVHQHRSLVLASLPLFEVVLEGVPLEVAGALQVDEFAAVLQVA